jgi:cytoskeletal protein CcmA (bactofilin family)
MALRRTLCTQCDGYLEIAEEAKSIACRHCGARVITEAMDVGGYVAVRRLAVANHVRITKKGLVYACVRADVLDVDGFLQGDGVGLAGIRLGRNAKVKGNLRGAVLVVEPGASFVGEVRIGLSEVPELETMRRVAEETRAAAGA